MKVFALLKEDGSLEKITHLPAEAERWATTGIVESGEVEIKEGADNYTVKTKNGTINLGPGLRSYVQNPPDGTVRSAPVQKAKAPAAQAEQPEQEALVK